MKTKPCKKGQIGIGDIPNVVRVIIVGGIFLAVGLIVMANMSSSVLNDFNANETVKNVSAGLLNISTNMPLIGTIVGLVIVLGVVLLIGASRRGM